MIKQNKEYNQTLVYSLYIDENHHNKQESTHGGKKNVNQNTQETRFQAKSSLYLYRRW